MALWVKAYSFTGKLVPLMTAIQRLPAVNNDFKRTAFTSHKRVKFFVDRKVKVKKEKKVEVEGVSAPQLYEKEISKEVFEAREKDLPLFEMANPFVREKKICILCKFNVTPDYKNVKLLSQFVSPHTGEVYGRHITGLCRIQQKRVEAEIKKSRHAGLMAQYLKQVEFLKDPKLCDPLRPTRPHPY